MNQSRLDLTFRFEKLRVTRFDKGVESFNQNNLKVVTLMLHTNNPIIKHKTGLLNLAEELGNVSKACKVMGVSRDTFYRYQELVVSTSPLVRHL